MSFLMNTVLVPVWLVLTVIVVLIATLFLNKMGED